MEHASDGGPPAAHTAEPRPPLEPESLWVRTQGQLLLTILDHADFVVLQYAPDGTLTWASRALTRLFGFDPAAVVGTVFRMAAPECQERVAQEFLAAAKEHRDATSIRMEAVAADGTRRTVDVTSRFEWDLDGAVELAVTIMRDVTAEVKRERQFRLLAENSVDVVLSSDDRGRLDWVSPSVTRTLGWEPSALIGRELVALIHPDDVAAIRCPTPDVLRGGMLTSDGPARFATSSRTWRWMHVLGREVLDADGVVLGGIDSLRDIEAETQAREALRASEALFRTALESTSVGIAVADAGRRFLVVNPALCELLGYPETWFLKHRLVDIVHPDDAGRALLAGDALLSGSKDTTVDTVRLVRSDAAVVWVRRTGAVIRDTGGRPDRLLLQIQDVTADRDARDALTHRAFHDPLTGLRNRAWILDILDVDLQTARRHGTSVGVLFVDIDNFKVVNDTLGHAAGDEVLAEIAKRIAQALRSGDRVGRFGGDEFVIVIPDAESPHAVAMTAQRVAQEISADLVVEGHLMVPTASIGIALSKASSTVSDMLRDTDAALFRAKHEGRSRLQIFDDAMHSRALLRQEVEDQLRAAVARREFVVHFQPVVRLADSCVVGHEALVRWAHPTRGLLPAEEFLAVAEESGQMRAIGAFVREQVRDALRDTAGAAGTISLNVSTAELARPGWLLPYCGELAELGVRLDRLVLELAEDTALGLLDAARAELETACELGVGLHVDDFGTGVSSIALLRDLPVTGLKLDGRFVSGVTVPGSSAEALSRALAGLAHGLDLLGIAEGIETLGQAEVLLEHGWTLGQGSRFAPPAPLPDPAAPSP